MEHQLNEIIEALLLSASRPVSIEEIEKVFVENPPSREEIRNSLNEIEENCLNRGIELKKVSSGFRLQVKQDLSGYVAKLWEERPQRFSKATLETLSLIAYKQPISRLDIEAIRGVDCAGVGNYCGNGNQLLVTGSSVWACRGRVGAGDLCGV